MSDRIKREAVEINLTEHCNLKCRGCDHGSPHLSEKFASFERVFEDLRALAGVMEVEEIKFVGGEPLLHPQLLDFMAMVRDVGIAKRLTVVTNGALLDRTDAKFWQSLDHLWVSVYPGVKYKMRKKELEKVTKEYGVELSMKKIKTFRQTLLNNKIDDTSLVEKIYSRCKLTHQYSCHTVHEGRYYKCSPAPFMSKRLALRGVSFQQAEEDSVPLHDNPTLKEDLERYLASTQPLSACSYCLGTVGQWFSHEQMSRDRRQRELDEDHTSLDDLIVWRYFDPPKKQRVIDIVSIPAIAETSSASSSEIGVAAPTKPVYLEGSDVLSVTIGIPCKNGEDYIGPVLENILRQSYPLSAIEVVIGNHDSTDETVEIAQSYTDRLNLTILRVDGKVHKSRAAVRNRILEQATGDVVVFIDADVLISRDLVKEHVDIHRKTENCIVTGYVFAKGDTWDLDEKAMKELKTDNISEKYELLKSLDAAKDSRETSTYVHLYDTTSSVPLGRRHYGWRGFWTCNMSVRRVEAVELGGFDETFVGWGLEDEEFAYRYAVRGKNLVYSTKAWGYHIPHHADIQKNYLEAADNAARFLAKYQNGELEDICLHYSTNGKLRRHVGRSPYAPKNPELANQELAAAGMLGPRNGTRAGIGMVSEQSAWRLDLTHCFLPFLDARTLPFKKQECNFYSLLGVQTPFEDRALDESILFVDLLMFFYASTVQHTLIEMCRISKKPVLCFGPVSRASHNRHIRERFVKSLESFDASHVVRLDV